MLNGNKCLKTGKLGILFMDGQFKEFGNLMIKGLS